MAAAVEVPRWPLALGVTKWGPLPGTADMWILWAGPGMGLTLHAANPSSSMDPGKRIRHPAASGEYQTLAEAGRAVNAFVAA